MEEKIKIREIEQKDDSALFKLVRYCLKEAGLDIPGTAYFDESIKAMSQFYLNNPRRKYFVLADENDEVLGGAGFAEFNGSNKVCELQKLYIDDKAKGKGYSYLLVDKVEKEAENAGFETIYLETHHNLPVALYLYKKLNYTQLENPLPGSEHGTMDYFFAKDLR